MFENLTDERAAVEVAHGEAIRALSRPMWLTLYTPSGQCVTLTPEPGRCLDQARIVSEVASGVRLLVPGTGGEIWTWGVVR